MKIFIIAQIMSGKKLVGYRLLDLDANNQVRDYNISTIAQVLNNPQTADLIKNARLINGVITGTNGQLSRYAKIDTNGNLLSSVDCPLVVINKIDNLGYTVADFKGQVKKMKNSDVVEYAKKAGIANGKVVIQDNVEYISSISDSYEQISVSPSKLGSRGRINLNISVDRDASSIAKHTENDVDTEIQYSDVFSVMTPEQRTVLKQYYAWYTVDVYKGLAKNVRLTLAPGKAEKLAQLRGIEKWQFAGVNDSYLEGRYSAKCELGHNLRYEYFAIPEELVEGADAKVKDWNNRLFRTTKGTQEDLRERGAIVFGETCAGDFFNIAPDDMKKLVKTRKTMSDEIELLADVITNHMENLYIEKCKFLYECIRAMGSGSTVVDVFGKQVGYTLLSFGKANIPFPKSLVILAGNEIRRNKAKFFKSIVTGYDNTIDKLINTNDKYNLAIDSINEYLNYITSFSVEGDYQYDPLNDKDCTRRDIGAYNKETRYKRTILHRRIFAGTGLSIGKYDSIETIEKLIKMVAKSFEVCRFTRNYVEKSELLSNYLSKDSETKLCREITRFAGDVDKVDKEQVSWIDALLSCLSFDNDFGRENNFNRRFVTYVSRYRSQRYIENFEALYSRFQDYIEKPTLDVLINNSLKLYEDSLDIEKQKKAEEELNRVIKAKLTLKENSTSKENAGDKPTILKLERAEREIIDLWINNKDAINISVICYGDIEVIASDIEKYEEIEAYEYVNLSMDVDRIKNRDKLEKEAQLEAERKRQEEEKKKKEEEKKAQEEKQQKLEFEQDTKMQELKKLLANNKVNDEDYGIKVAKDILDRQIPFNKLSSKQQWRIDETLKQLTGQSSNETSNKKKLDDCPEVKSKVDKLLDIYHGKDGEAKNKVIKASAIAFNIAATMKKKGEFSDKQLKHIEKAYEAIK